jgi:HK97 family phage major capsid protein/HK97 family phage prohead protease
MLKRAYSVLRVKSADPVTRVISGTASTPEPDRLGDIVEPLGISFKNPVPLLLYHDATKPVGSVRFFPPTADGLDFEATLPVVDDPGTLKDRIDEAWQSIKAGLMAAVSIGFRSIEETWMKDAQAFRFMKSEVLELSLVTIPANASATIDTIKALDRAALGARHTPGVTGIPVVRALKDASPMNKIGEQIKTWEATRAAKVARQTELMTAANDGGVTLDPAQADEYDGLATDLKGIDQHLVRLNAMSAANLAAAAPVGATPGDLAATQRGAATPPPAAGRVITVKSNLPPATAFVRYVRAMIMARGNRMEAIEIAKQWRDSCPEVELALKAATAIGTTSDVGWAGPLAPIVPLASEFLELLRAQVVLSKIPGMRHVPFNISVAQQTGGGTYQWVGQGAPKPVGKLAFSATTLTIAKCAGIIVISEELARTSTPSAEDVIRNDMMKGIASFLDVEFTDPTKAAIANVSPGSVTNGVTPITSAGTTPANARTDIQAMAAAMLALNMSTAQATLLMSETNALALTSALNPLGQPLFPLMSPLGGSILGYKAIASQALGNNVVLINGEGILIADEGGIEIDVSREASVQMDSAPMNPADATVVMTSLWQNNLVGLRADRIINWKRARPGSVQFTVQTYAA